MSKTKERGIYQGISLPIQLIDVMKKYINKHPEYKGVTDFTREAIREKIRRESNAKNPV